MLTRILATLFVVCIAISPINSQKPKAAAETKEPLTNADVVKLTRLGVPDEVIGEIIGGVPRVAFSLNSRALQSLRLQGVSEQTISKMQERSRPDFSVSNLNYRPVLPPMNENASKALLITKPGNESSIFTDTAESTDLEGIRNLFSATLDQFHGVQCGSQGTYNDVLSCHKNYSAGCSPSANPKYDAYLNLVKNIIPSGSPAISGQINKRDQLAFLEKATYPLNLTDTNHASLKDSLSKTGEGRFVTAQGYLYYGFVSNGKDAEHLQGETSNCGLTAEDASDFHIGIGFAPFPLPQAVLDRLRKEDMREVRKTMDVTPLEQNAMVVEMTPHLRKMFFPGWTIEKLRKQIGSLVRVSGQLMIDNAHYSSSQDCLYPNPDMSKCWRLSAWEVHPVNAFEVCTQMSGSGCAAGKWVPLTDLP